MKKELEKLLEKNQGTITEFIINEALEHEDPKQYTQIWLQMMNCTIYDIYYKCT